MSKMGSHWSFEHLKHTSYGLKKGRESNSQFDSQPLKVKNQLDFVACKQCATYHWKAFDKGYNFAWDVNASKVCTQNYVPPKS
jgi:hypothetical protein